MTFKINPGSNYFQPLDATAITGLSTSVLAPRPRQSVLNPHPESAYENRSQIMSSSTHNPPLAPISLRIKAKVLTIFVAPTSPHSSHLIYYLPPWLHRPFEVLGTRSPRTFAPTGTLFLQRTTGLASPHPVGLHGPSSLNFQISCPLCQYCYLSFSTENLALVYYLLTCLFISVRLLPLDARAMRHGC